MWAVPITQMNLLTIGQISPAQRTGRSHKVCRGVQPLRNANSESTTSDYPCWRRARSRRSFANCSLLQTSWLWLGFASSTCADYGEFVQTMATYCQLKRIRQLANKQSPQYADIKTAGDVTLGFPTQVLLIEKLAKAGPQYWQNVALKVNVKRQGTNQILANGLPGFMRTPTMVFGAE